MGWGVCHGCASKVGIRRGRRVLLRIRDLSKRFGQFTALKDISLDVKQGDFVCFLGPSGCGKTTLLRAIAGLDPQDEGMIEIGGRDVSHLPPAARDFGIVFQSYALFPNLSVAANVGYGLVNRRRARVDRARVAELLTLVGLPEQGKKYPVQLSGGQQQRVALARALATSPGLLLLDEPLSALDARVRLRLRDEIKALQRRLGVTTVMVTHDQEEALAMADCIVVMNQGVIEQVGASAGHLPQALDRVRRGFRRHHDVPRCRDRGADVAARRHDRARLSRCGALPRGSPVRIGLRPKRSACAISTIRRRTRSPRRSRRSTSRLVLPRALKPDAAPNVAILADFSLNLMRDLSVAEGQALTVALPPESLRVFGKP